MRTQPPPFVYTLSMAAFVLQWQSCDRDHMACKARNIFYLSLYTKGLLANLFYKITPSLRLLALEFVEEGLPLS